MSVLKRIEKTVDNGINHAIVITCNGLLLTVAVAIFVEIITRYIFGISHGQVLEYCTFFGLWIGLLSAGKLTRENYHISISIVPDTLTRRSKVRARAILNIAIHLSVLVFAVMFLYFGAVAALIVKASGSVMILPYVPPYWLYSMSLPVAAVFLTYYEIKKIVQITRSLSRLSGKE